MNREPAERILQKVNTVIEEGRRIIVREVSKDETLRMQNLARTEPWRELIKRLDSVRIVEIEGLGCADGWRPSRFAFKLDRKA
ncbi:MAG: hypothetical protein QXF01_02430 [Candidatus Micrarchaeaceae archaeon]